MTHKYALTLAIKAATVLAWTVAALDALPFDRGFDLNPHQYLFVVAAACVSSYSWIQKAHARPLMEVYFAGKDIGRRDALLEQKCENVKRMSEAAPNLRVVSGH